MPITIVISAPDVSKGILSFYMSNDGTGAHVVKRYAQGDLVNGVSEVAIDMALSDVVAGGGLTDPQKTNLVGLISALNTFLTTQLGLV